MSATLLETGLGAMPLYARGKVRDLFDIDGALLFIATDRISAFDHVLATGIPDKGRVLTQLSLFWFEHMRDVVQNHLITAKVEEYPKALQPYEEMLRGRSMLVRRARMFPIECVARGYLSGSGWKEYRESGTICGIRLPSGLVESDRLPQPIFTPATKIEQGGHDINISFDDATRAIGGKTAEKLRSLTLELYRRAAQHAESRGLILADTKFEFGIIGESKETEGTIVLADEVLTPDSSRYWPMAGYKPGGAQPSFDKQYVRDYLESIHWNKQAPAPALPEFVVEQTRQKYLEAFRLITGHDNLD
jgi:phosphoribosylaminoimidazole-succinocarboxamide synthase